MLSGQLVPAWRTKSGGRAAHRNGPVTRSTSLRTASFRLRSTVFRLAFGLLLVCLAPTAFVHATPQTLYQTSFEAPAFTPGLPIRGQDNWEMFHDGEAISVSTNNPRTGAQCLRFDGALLEQAGPNFVTAYCFSRALEAYSNNPPAIVEIFASVRLDGPRTGTNGTPDQDILSANLMAVTPRPDGRGDLLGGFFVSSAGRIWSYSANPADSYKFSVPYTFGTYRTLRLRVDFIARTLRYFVDGTYLGMVNFPPAITADRLASGYLSLSGALDPINTPELTYDPQTTPPTSTITASSRSRSVRLTRSSSSAPRRSCRTNSMPRQRCASSAAASPTPPCARPSVPPTTRQRQARITRRSRPL
jgi:hypothetical protein